VALGVGIVCSLVGALAGYRLAESRHKRRDRTDLIRDVADKYRDLRESNESSGLDALIRSGVTRLCSTDDLDEAIRLIREFGHTDPLGPLRERLQGKDIFHFFKLAQERRRRLHVAAEFDRLIADTRPI